MRLGIKVLFSNFYIFKSIKANIFVCLIAILLHSLDDKKSENYSWVAFDSNIASGESIRPLRFCYILHKLIEPECDHSDITKNVSGFNVTLLRRVMRCSENVFCVAYHSKKSITTIKPICGHKISGPECVLVNKRCRTKEEAHETVWVEIKKFI